jgi:hypothetical protein
MSTASETTIPRERRAPRHLDYAHRASLSVQVTKYKYDTAFYVQTATADGRGHPAKGASLNVLCSGGCLVLQLQLLRRLERSSQVKHVLFSNGLANHA